MAGHIHGGITGFSTNGKQSRRPSMVTSITTGRTGLHGWHEQVSEALVTAARETQAHCGPSRAEPHGSRWTLLAHGSFRFSCGRRTWGQEVDSGMQGSQRASVNVVTTAP